MERKKWSAQTDITPSVVKARDKSKWQIAFRRYVVEQNPSPTYAPYFGLDISSIRKWFEYQFEPDMNWENFGKDWQFEHIIPVTFFDFKDEKELKLCWHFTNIHAVSLKKEYHNASQTGILTAKLYFEELFKRTKYSGLLSILDKIDQIEAKEIINTEKQQAFLKEHKHHLAEVENYTPFELELLNNGRTTAEISKHFAYLRNYV